MKERMRILIGYDGSPCADAALDDLRRAGLPRDVEAVIFTVSEMWFTGPSNHESNGSDDRSSSSHGIVNSKTRQGQAATAFAPVSDAASLALAARARLQSRFPAWVIDMGESSGSPSREILKKAADLKPHLIVVGCHGRSALGGFLLGSVSQKVVNEARCTVRVSRGTAWKDGSPVRIIIGLDGTAGSELAVNAVASRVWPTSSAVRLITAVDPSDRTVKVVSQKKNSSVVKPMNREFAEKFMKDAARKLRGTLLSVSTRIEAGDPKRILIADAEEWGADCIFLGASSADSLLDRFLLGNVATAVVARAHCSVEIVRNGINLPRD
jgi:nucleotide-binding universal stress UspA family protein